MKGLFHSLSPIFTALGVWTFFSIVLLVMWMLLVGIAHSIRKAVAGQSVVPPKPSDKPALRSVRGDHKMALSSRTPFPFKERA